MRKLWRLAILTVICTTACFQRVQVHDPELIEEYDGSILVYLKPTEEEPSRTIIITQPQVDSQLLRGKANGKEVVIPMRDVLYFEFAKLDKKKTLIASTAFVIVALIALRTYAPGLVVNGEGNRGN